MQQAAIEVPDLALGVQQLPACVVQPLHAAFAAAPLIGFLYPLTLLLPVVIELRTATLGYRHEYLPLA
jgi:hypothetical protein